MNENTTVTDAAGSEAIVGGHDDGPETFGIADLAEAFDVTPRAIRFYEARGLITPRRAGTTRIYSRRDRARLALILRGKSLGFSLEDIREYLELYDHDPVQAAQTQLLLEKVEAHLAELQVKRANLERAVRELNDIRDRCLAHLKTVKPTS